MMQTFRQVACRPHESCMGRGPHWSRPGDTMDNSFLARDLKATTSQEREGPGERFIKVNT